MGSETIHCIGYAPITETKSRLFYAMNKVEIAQARYKAVKYGLKIEYWNAQTGTGERIIGGVMVDDNKITTPKMITCPVCEGDGHNGNFFCPVCNGSGISRPGNEKRWQQWQIENMRSHRLVVEYGTGISLGGISEDLVK